MDELERWRSECPAKKPPFFHYFIFLTRDSPLYSPGRLALVRRNVETTEVH